VNKKLEKCVFSVQNVFFQQKKNLASLGKKKERKKVKTCPG
jgi:hypothetical protein